MRDRAVGGCLAALAACAVLSGRAELSVAGIGKVSPAGVPEGLSGLACAASNQYVAAGDSGGRMSALTITLDPATGAITSVVMGVTRALGGTDLEGIAYNRIRDSVYVSDETGPAIQEYAVGGGAVLTNLPLPAVYASYRDNYSLESLTLSPDGRTLWTANEEALFRAATGVDDGPLSSPSGGSLVRLQRWTRASPLDGWTADGQWAYLTQAWRADSPFITEERSGVSDLCALPNGHLLVLERDLSGFIPTLQNRIYDVDFTGATDTASLPALNGAAVTPVAKRQLWSGNFGTSENFEGLCLGPQLEGGDYSLLMVADGDAPLNPGFYALRLSATAADAWHTLEVRSPYGVSGPPVWGYDHPDGSVLTQSVGSPLQVGTTQHVCTGWTLSGVDATTGTTQSVTLTLTNDAVLTWNWLTSYRVDTAVVGRGSVQPAAGWLPAGTNLSFRAVPAVGYAFDHWTGFSGRPTLSPTVPWTLTQPLSVTAHFVRAPAHGVMLIMR